MLGLKYFKADPSNHIQVIKNGKMVKQGKGLAFFYYAPTTALVKIPTTSEELPFFFQVDTADFQELNVQGQLSYQFTDMTVASNAINFAINTKGEYVSNEPSAIAERVVRALQVAVKSEVESQGLRALLKQSKDLSARIFDTLNLSPALSSIGITLQNIALTNLSPSTDTAKALEAEVRESLLKEADNAIYQRRIASLAQDKHVKETELETEKALQRKQQEMEKAVIEAEREQAQQRFVLNQESIKAQIDDEQQRSELVALEVENQRQQSLASTQATERELAAYSSIDEARLRILMMSKMGPNQLIASAFEELAKSDNKIGNLNISPDLLQNLLNTPA